MNASRTVLITGGTGFIGRHLARRLRAGGHDVHLGGRNNAQSAAAATFSGCAVLPLDVTNIESVRDAVARIRPDLVIHAAATKYVDLSEQQPMECIDVNVLGSQNVARVCIDRGVRTVVGISTDKAAPPAANLYGLSKAMMERMYCALDGVGGTQFACVRFGNVAWSTGSVFPIWTRMLREKGVIQTTGPEMRRFFFRVDDAVNLVTTALDHVDELQGSILVRDMKAVRMRDILEVWKARRGIRYEVIAARPGDSVDQLLLGESELPFARPVRYEGVDHVLISPKVKAARPLSAVVSSATAEKLSEEEIAALIEDPGESGE